MKMVKQRAVVSCSKSGDRRLTVSCTSAGRGFGRFFVKMGNTKICTESVRTASRISKLTGVLEIGQPPYSPDLAPTDFSLLRETKTALKKF